VPIFSWLSDWHITNGMGSSCFYDFGHPSNPYFNCMLRSTYCAIQYCGALGYGSLCVKGGRLTSSLRGVATLPPYKNVIATQNLSMSKGKV